MTNVVVYIRNHYILYGNNSLTTIYCAYHPDKAVKPMSQQPLYSLHAFIGRSGSLRAQTNAYILYSCHPRSRKKLEASGFQLNPRVRINEPLGFNDYNKLQMNALAIVSDSGTLPEESSFYLSIGHPIAAVCIRTSTERPEALEAGDFILAGISTNELLQATDMAIRMKREGVLGKPCPDYVDENVSMKVVRIIQGYVNVVNKMVWRKG